MTKRGDRRHVLVIGQIPPPMDGLAYITSEFANLLNEDNDVKVLNISPRTSKRGLAYHLTRAATVLFASFHLILDARIGNRVCYMPCQSDIGLIYTIYLLALSRALRYPAYLHHHNFGYINEHRRMMRFALQIGGPDVVHIFLCEYMQERFGQTYWTPKQSAVISNSAFVPSQAVARSPVGAPLKVGLLSNLSREKGLYHFLDLLRAGRSDGLNIEGLLAGPLREAEDKAAVEAAQKELGNALTYAGPLYGDKKQNFFASIDVFVFPTMYVNEAQPTVLYEALAAGNLIVTYERGCTGSQIGRDGLVIPQDEPFVPLALDWLRKIQAGGGIDRASIASRMFEMHRSARAKARAILDHFETEVAS